MCTDGDITPITDVERQFTTFALLAGAFVFAYILGDISSLLASLDRQSSLVEEKLDAVKEYLQWRGIPKELSLRIKRYYEYFYTQQAVFDEKAILSNLSPDLHSETVRCILRETLEHIPLFERLNPDFQIAVFPHLKPLSVSKGEVIYARGSVSATLYFLIKGEVAVMGGDNMDVVTRIIRPANVHQETDAPSRDVEVESTGCFGQETLIGRRRETTLRAESTCDLLNLDKESLESIFSADPLSARRVCVSVLEGFQERDRRRRHAMYYRMMTTPGQNKDLKAALLVQYKWFNYCDIMARENDSLYRFVLQTNLTSAQRFQSRAEGSLKRNPGPLVPEEATGFVPSPPQERPLLQRQATLPRLGSTSGTGTGAGLHASGASVSTYGLPGAGAVSGTANGDSFDKLWNEMSQLKRQLSTHAKAQTEVLDKVSSIEQKLETFISAVGFHSTRMMLYTNGSTSPGKPGAPPTGQPQQHDSRWL